jgi:hypothetical protein
MAEAHLPTPTSSPAFSQQEASGKGTGERKLKGYRRIRFKNWQPEGATGSDGQTQSGTHRWRVSKDANKTGDDEKAARAVVRAKYGYRIPSPVQPLPENGHRQDPFVTLPIEATECVKLSLDFFLATCIPIDRKSEQVVGRTNPHMTMLFPFMLKEPMLFETVVTLCRTSILLSQNKKVEEDAAFVYHRGRSLRAVTSKLTSAEGISDASMLSIAMILTLEYLIGNIAAVAAHLSGLQRMLDMRPDLDGSTEWKRFVKAGVVAYQSMGSFVAGLPLDVPGNSPGFIKEAFTELQLYHPLIYPSVPYSPELCTILARLPSGLAELCLSGNLSQQTIKFLAFTSATTNYCEGLEEMDERLDHEIQAMFSAIQRMSLMQPTSLESRLLCGLLAYAFQLRQLKPLNLFHDPPLRRFVNSLANHEKPDSSRAQDAMVWVSMAAAGALRLRTIVMPGTHAVLDRMFQLYPATKQWSYVETVLKAHFWTTSIGKHWQDCWTNGLAHWRIIEKRRVLQHDMVQLGYSGIDSFATALSPIDDEDDHDDADQPVSMKDMTEYVRGAAHSMAEMMDAAAKCPFQSRMGPRIESVEKVMAPLCPVSHKVNTGA